MGYKHSIDDLVAAATEVALEHGMAKLTFARVAGRVGISDRMVVYYFPTKADLVRATAAALGVELQRLLAEAFGGTRRPPDDLVRVAWPVLTTAQADRIFRIFFEMIGLAAAGSSPYDELVPAILDAWADWVADRIEGASAELRRRQAVGVIARLDGLLLVRHTLGADAAEEAALALGVR